MAIEPLAILLRSTSDIQGISRGDREHKLSLYADDLLLFVADPHNSLPHVMTALEHFGRISGYKLNLSKSELFPINRIAKNMYFTPYPFAVAPDKFTYLGVVVSRNISELFKLNFTPILEQTRISLEKWSKLPTSLIGRINVVKMNTLPKFLYLFQTVPIYIKESFFAHLNKIISSYLWNKKPPQNTSTISAKP